DVPCAAVRACRRSVAPFFFQAEDGIRAFHVTGVQTCALPISDTESVAAPAAPNRIQRALLFSWGGGVAVKIAVYPGSFDPVTYGHLDIIQRAADLFDRLYVAVLRNPNKKALFSVEERVEMLRLVTSHLENVECESFDGLVVRYAQGRQASVIVR